MINPKELPFSARIDEETEAEILGPQFVISPNKALRFLECPCCSGEKLPTTDVMRAGQLLHYFVENMYTKDPEGRIRIRFTTQEKMLEYLHSGFISWLERESQISGATKDQEVLDFIRSPVYSEEYAHQIDQHLVAFFHCFHLRDVKVESREQIYQADIEVGSPDTGFVPQTFEAIIDHVCSRKERRKKRRYQAIEYKYTLPSDIGQPTTHPSHALRRLNIQTGIQSSIYQTRFPKRGQLELVVYGFSEGLGYMRVDGDEPLLKEALFWLRQAMKLECRYPNENHQPHISPLADPFHGHQGDLIAQAPEYPGKEAYDNACDAFNRYVESCSWEPYLLANKRPAEVVVIQSEVPNEHLMYWDFLNRSKAWTTAISESPQSALITDSRVGKKQAVVIDTQIGQVQATHSRADFELPQDTAALVCVTPTDKNLLANGITFTTSAMEVLSPETPVAFIVAGAVTPQTIDTIKQKSGLVYQRVRSSLPGHIVVQGRTPKNLLLEKSVNLLVGPSWRKEWIKKHAQAVAVWYKDKGFDIIHGNEIRSALSNTTQPTQTVRALQKGYGVEIKSTSCGCCWKISINGYSQQQHQCDPGCTTQPPFSSEETKKKYCWDKHPDTPLIEGQSGSLYCPDCWKEGHT